MSRPWKRFGAGGFVRIDACASTPVIEGRADPGPLVRALLELTEASPPRRGSIWRLSSASVPGDVAVFYLSRSGMHLPVPPFGVLELGLLSGLLHLGVAMIPAAGIDPLTVLSIPVLPDPRLNGVRVQAFNHIRSLTSRLFLSNGMVTVIE